MQQLGFSDGRNRPDRPKDRSRHLSVYANKRDRIGPALSFAPAEGKRSDIDSELPESASDLADDSGFVPVSQIENRALELRLQRNTLDLQHARRAVMKHCAFRRKLSRCAGFFGKCGDFQSVWKTMFAPASLFFDGQASSRRHRWCIDDVHFFIGHGI